MLAAVPAPVIATADRTSLPDAGFSLVEVLVAGTILTIGLVSLAQLFALAASQNMASKNTTYTSILAAQKLEELRALEWAFDSSGQPIGDMAADTASANDATTGGTGLAASPPTALQESIDGYVDYLDRFGTKLGGGQDPPGAAVYTRRWSIEPLPGDADHTIIIQVLVTTARGRGAARSGAGGRRPDETRMVALRTRTSH